MNPFDSYMLNKVRRLKDLRTRYATTYCNMSLCNRRVIFLSPEYAIMCAPRRKEACMDQQIVVYKPSEKIKMEVKTDGETVWLTIDQMSVLFGRCYFRWISGEIL